MPNELCIYRGNNGVYDKETSYTLRKEQRKNQEMKQTVERLRLLLEAAKAGHGHAEDIFTLKNNTPDVGKLLQLNPLRNPLFCTLLETPTGTKHLGSISVAALLRSDPRIRYMVTQVNSVLSQQRQRYQVDVNMMSKAQVMLDVFEERCFAAKSGFPVYDGDAVIANLVAEIQSKLPPKPDMESFMFQFSIQNQARWIGVPYTDMDELWEQYNDLIYWDQDGRAHLKLLLPDDGRKLEFLAFLMNLLAWLTFTRICRLQPRVPPEVQQTSMNYVLFARYSQALLSINQIGQQIKLGDPLLSPLTTKTLLIHHMFEKHFSVSNYLNLHDHGSVEQLTTKHLISVAKSQHLHEDIDRWYPRYNLSERRSLKSIWYNIVLLDLLESLECGTLSTIQPSELMAEDGTHSHPLQDAVAKIHWVIYDFNFIDDVILLDDLVNFIDSSSIPKLTACYKQLGVPFEDDIKLAAEFDPKRYSDKRYIEEQLLAGQRAMLRYIIFATMSAMYHVCLVRFIQNGEPTNSLRYRKALMLTLKYALAGMQLYKLHMELLHSIGNGDDPLKQTFYFSIILLLNRFLGLSSTRASLTLVTVVSSMMGLDNTMASKYILYGDESGRDEEILEMCRQKGLVYESNNMLDFVDFETDTDIDDLTAKWGKYTDLRVLVATGYSYYAAYRDYSKMKCLNINFMKMQRSYTFGFKFMSYSLNRLFEKELDQWLASKGNDPTNVVGQEYEMRQRAGDNGNGSFAGSFKDFFDSSIALKTGDQFSFQSFFGSHLDIPKDDIEEYFRRAPHGL